jgi:hypothetical protein
MSNLRQAVAQLEENELFEQTLRRGSQAALQIQPSTNDIDTLMRSMMDSSINITADRPHMGVSIAPVPLVRDRSGATTTISESTVGKRSRNGTSRNAHKG